MQGDDDDLDRAAILARRNRFIAVALSGLATGVGCAPQTCLKVIAPQDPGAQRPARPEACLSVAYPEPRQPEPRPEPLPVMVTPPPEPSPPPSPPPYVPLPTTGPQVCLTIMKPRTSR